MRQGPILLRLAMMIAAVMTLNACSDDPLQVDATDSTPAWEAVQNPEPPVDSYWFDGIWGTEFGDVFVVGRSMVLHHDGRGWKFLRHDDGAQYYDVWGELNDLYVVGADGGIIHYDGATWQGMDSGTTADLHGVWGSSGHDVFAVGSGGTVLHYDGRGWSGVTTGIDQTLRDVWGDGRGTFAVGDNGTILALESNEAQAVHAPTSNNLTGIGGCQESGLCVVGAAGTILRYDGSTWSGVRSGTTAAFEAVCGTSDGQLLVVGDGAALHFDRFGWEFMDMSDVSSSFGYDGMVGVWGTSNRNMFVLGNTAVVHYDGSSWHPLELPVSDPFESWGALVDVWGSSESDVYAVGLGEGVLRYDGSTWTSAGGARFDAVWGIAENVVFALRTDSHTNYDPWSGTRSGWTEGIVTQYDGTDWIVTQELRDVSFNSMWGLSETDFFVAGSATEFTRTGGGGVVILGFKHYPRVLRCDGGVWSAVYGVDTEGTVHDIWGSSETDVYAVGSDGLIVHFDGSDWAEMNSGTSVVLLATWGSSSTDIVAVGNDGTILHCDGNSWSPMASGTSEALNDIWGSSAKDIFAVGAIGTLVHYDGARWSAQSSPTRNDLYGIWGSAADDIYAVGQYGTILHYGRR